MGALGRGQRHCRAGVQLRRPRRSLQGCRQDCQARAERFRQAHPRCRRRRIHGGGGIIGEHRRDAGGHRNRHPDGQAGEGLDAAGEGGIVERQAAVRRPAATEAPEGYLQGSALRGGAGGRGLSPLHSHPSGSQDAAIQRSGGVWPASRFAAHLPAGVLGREAHEIPCGRAAGRHRA